MKIKKNNKSKAKLLNKKSSNTSLKTLAKNNSKNKVKAVKKPLKPNKIAKSSEKKITKKLNNSSKTLPKLSSKSVKKTPKKTSTKKNLQIKSSSKISNKPNKSNHNKDENKTLINQKNTQDSKAKKKDITKNSSPKVNNFSINSFVVYPSHGVGKIINIESTKINQIEISCYLIFFEREKLTIRIPVKNVEKFNIRPLVSKAEMDEVFSILRSGVKKMKGMWSRRAQEYETKINSGDIIMLAEVIRDLTRDIEDSERSYSERIIYETAIFRLASEYSAIYGISIEDAQNKVLITAKDKLDSEIKNSKKDDFDDFDKIKDPDEEDDEDDEEEDEEEDDFNYEYNEGDEDDDDDDDDKPRKKKK
jgi:CarD family transcriptional regulator